MTVDLDAARRELSEMRRQISILTAARSQERVVAAEQARRKALQTSSSAGEKIGHDLDPCPEGTFTVPWAPRPPSKSALKREAGRLHRFLGGSAAEQLERVRIEAGAAGETERDVEAEQITFAGSGKRPNRVAELREAAGLSLSELAATAALPEAFVAEVEERPREGLASPEPDAAAQREISFALGVEQSEAFPWS